MKLAQPSGLDVYFLFSATRTIRTTRTMRISAALEWAGSGVCFAHHQLYLGERAADCDVLVKARMLQRALYELFLNLDSHGEMSKMALYDQPFDRARMESLCVYLDHGGSELTPDAATRTFADVSKAQDAWQCLSEKVAASQEVVLSVTEYSFVSVLAGSILVDDHVSVSVQLSNTEHCVPARLYVAATAKWPRMLQHWPKSLLECESVLLDLLRLNATAFEDVKSLATYIPEKTLLLAAFEDKQRAATAFQQASDVLQLDDEVGRLAIKVNPSSLRWASSRLQDDDVLVFQALKTCGYLLKYVNTRFRGNLQAVMTALDTYANAYLLATPEVKLCRDVVLKVVSLKGTMLRHVMCPFARDRAVVHAAVCQNGMALKFADRSLQHDYRMVLCAVRTYPQVIQEIGLAKRFRKDSKIAALSVAADGESLGMFAHKFRNSKPLVLAALKNHPSAWFHVANELRFDPDVLNALVSTPRSSDLRDMFRSHRLTKFGLMRELTQSIEWMQAIKCNGCLLEFAPPHIKYSKDAALAAVSQCAEELRIVPPGICNSVDVVLAAACQNVHAPDIFVV